MYLKNGFFVKNQWFYVLPIGLFLFLNIKSFFAPEVDYSAFVAQIGSNSPQGEKESIGDVFSLVFRYGEALS